MDRERQAARNAESTALINLPFVCMADRTQIEMITGLGQLRSPFHGLSDWPWLDEALADASTRLLKSDSKRAWERATGGVLDQHKRPYCTMASPLATQVVEKLAVEPGGLLWMDDLGMAWAVKLGPSSPTEPSQRYGFAITWGGNAMLLDQGARHECGRRLGHGLQGSSNDDRQAGRDHLTEMAQRLRLFNRAEQLLWAIHLAILCQRRSAVLLPDVLLGQVIWGGNRDDWPQDWRGDIMQTLRSLTYLHTEVLRLSGSGWQPRLGAHSVGVPHVELLALTRPHDDICRPCCPMYQSPVRHGHFFIQIGCGFLGVLEKFMVADDGNGTRTYDFGRQPDGETGKELALYQESGRTPSVNILVKLLGPSRWSGLSPEHRRIVQAMAEEVTRGRGSRRPDKAFVLHGNRVPGIHPGSELVCPLLTPDAAYVAFNGNGRRRGAGYRIIGEADRGWLHKCGYELPDGDDGMGKVVRQFLTSLKEVGEILGLVIVAVHPKTAAWLDIGSMMQIAKRRSGWERLDPLHLRLYGPEDYLERCRAYLERQGNFAGAKPNGTIADAVACTGGPAVELALGDRMHRAGVKQEDLADHLGRSRSFVSRLLNDQKPWPPGTRERAEAFIRAAEKRGEQPSADGLTRAHYSV